MKPTPGLFFQGCYIWVHFSSHTWCAAEQDMRRYFDCYIEITLQTFQQNRHPYLANFVFSLEADEKRCMFGVHLVISHRKTLALSTADDVKHCINLENSGMPRQRALFLCLSSSRMKGIKCGLFSSSVCALYFLLFLSG